MSIFNNKVPVIDDAYMSTLIPGDVRNLMAKAARVYGNLDRLDFSTTHRGTMPIYKHAIATLQHPNKISAYWSPLIKAVDSQNLMTHFDMTASTLDTSEEADDAGPAGIAFVKCQPKTRTKLHFDWIVARVPYSSVDVKGAALRIAILTVAAKLDQFYVDHPEQRLEKPK